MSQNILKFKKKPGMTMVELVIYIAITMIVLVVIIDLVTRVAQVKTQSSGQEIILENARFLNDRLTYAISNASSLDGSLPADNLTLTLNGAAINFTLSEGKIYYFEAGGGPVALTNNKVEIRSVDGENIFKKISSGSAESVEIKFRVVNLQTNIQKDFQTTVLRRGK